MDTLTFEQFVKAKIASLEEERMTHFANWNRVEGALFAWREALSALAGPLPDGSQTLQADLQTPCAP